MAPRETENNAYAKIGVTNKEHYSMLWYFLEWSIGILLKRSTLTSTVVTSPDLNAILALRNTEHCHNSRCLEI